MLQIFFLKETITYLQESTKDNFSAPDKRAKELKSYAYALERVSEEERSDAEHTEETEKLKKSSTYYK